MGHADTALMELGRLIGMPDLSFNAEGRAALEFDGAFKINIYREDANTIELWARISGFGPVSDPLVMRHALEGNFINGMSGGARLALEPGAQQFSLCERIKVTSMTGAELEQALHSFLAVLSYWVSPEAMPERRSPLPDDEPMEAEDDSVFIRL